MFGVQSTHIRSISAHIQVKTLFLGTGRLDSEDLHIAHALRRSEGVLDSFQLDKSR